MVKSDFPKEVGFQRCPGDQAQPLQAAPSLQENSLNPSTPPGAPGGMAPADESCIFETKAGASLLAERPLTLFSACLRILQGLSPERTQTILSEDFKGLAAVAAFQTRQAKDFNPRFKRTRDQKQMLLEDTSPACPAVWGHGYGGEDDSSLTM